MKIIDEEISTEIKARTLFLKTYEVIREELETVEEFLLYEILGKTRQCEGGTLEITLLENLLGSFRKT